MKLTTHGRQKLSELVFGLSVVASSRDFLYLEIRIPGTFKDSPLSAAMHISSGAFNAQLTDEEFSVYGIDGARGELHNRMIWTTEELNSLRSVADQVDHIVRGFNQHIPERLQIPGIASIECEGLADGE